jgi:glycerol-3-phosphate dehydrogenase
LHGWLDTPSEGTRRWEQVYGADLPKLQELSQEDPTLDQLVHPAMPYKLREIVWAARYEMARTVEDVLSRRTHALFLHARAAIEATPVVARVLAQELKRSDSWMKADLAAFLSIANDYVYKED